MAVTATRIDRGRNTKVGTFASTDTHFYDIKGHTANSPSSAIAALQAGCDLVDITGASMPNFTVNIGDNHEDNVTLGANMRVQYMRVSDPYNPTKTIVEVYYSTINVQFGGGNTVSLAGGMGARREMMNFTRFTRRDSVGQSGNTELWDGEPDTLPRFVRFRYTRVAAADQGAAEMAISDIVRYTGYLVFFSDSTHGGFTPGTNTDQSVNPSQVLWQYASSTFRQSPGSSGFIVTHFFRHDAAVSGINYESNTPILYSTNYPTIPGSPATGYTLPIPYIPEHGRIRHMFSGPEGSPRYSIEMPAHWNQIIPASTLGIT